MELKKILAEIQGLKASGNLEQDIPNIASDSRKIKEGDMFVAIEGFEVDGHKFIDNAIQNGAKTILINESKVKELNRNILNGITIKPEKIIYKPYRKTNDYKKEYKKHKVIKKEIKKSNLELFEEYLDDDSF